MTLKGQVIVITGASSGIGEATARMLARNGARVVLAARRRERLEALKTEIDAGVPERSLAVTADITLPEDRERLVQETLKTYGRIDGLVNNAGYGQRGPIETVPIEMIRQNFETNLFSLIAISQLVIPIMRNQRRGRIVNISSVAGRIARPLSSIYDATKHALEAISDGMRGELAPFGIKVVVVEPGFIITEFLEVAKTRSRPIEDEGLYTERLAKVNDDFKRVRGLAGKPDDIARLVLKALTAPNPRIRYAGPGHAHVLLALKRLLPDRIIDYVIGRQAGTK
jgi:short-subunit dehydrogenase